jgi:hypothetical protein
VAKTFAQALCARFGCAADDYLRVALEHSLYPRARVVFRIIPFAFARAADVKLLEEARMAPSLEYLEELLWDYWMELHLHGGLLARRLKLRVSGERLKRLFQEVMSEA